MNETAWKGSREGWLSSAYEALVDGGVDAVKILPLAKKLNVSRTSFYWFFTDREQLLEALLANWNAKNTSGIQGRCEAYAETIAEAMLNIMDCWLDSQIFDSQFEFAVRSWALQSPEVAAQVLEADEARLSALAAMFTKFGFSDLDAEVRARTVYLVQIGYISMNTREDIALRMRRIPSYVQIYTGDTPQRREMERFASRHSFILEPERDAAAGIRGANKEV
ncbi:TetR/AcrR family transcriptional regulator [Tianweitania populi]|uniref:TetR family transcriptional regulator n=1 Tax=Tianweitania populi TaxID=1607949 RepID=A0A8J3DUU6_9HYPH|nr:TetR/AcrR family transcriptional regulator [Tianweitania populi]GHD12178.1 TetR family transcriptional regulator [Tianweitania populi]